MITRRGFCQFMMALAAWPLGRGQGSGQKQESESVCWYVHNSTGTDGPGHGKSPDSPYATLGFAVRSCSTGRGDTVFVMPGHEETTNYLEIFGAGLPRTGTAPGVDKPNVEFPWKNRSQ